VYDQPNEIHRRVGQLEESVERLTSEVTSLKLELATLISALRDTHFQQPHRAPEAVQRIYIAPPVRASMAPATIVVMLAVGLLSWQLTVTPHRDPSIAPAHRAAAAIDRVVDPVAHAAVPDKASTARATEPTVYKGTLSVNADRPGATVFVNRKSVGTAPVRVRNLRAGSHLVWVESDGYRRWTRVVTVPAERVTRVSVDLEPDTEKND
jgi:PEGA domain